MKKKRRLCNVFLWCVRGRKKIPPTHNPSSYPRFCTPDFFHASGRQTKKKQGPCLLVVAGRKSRARIPSSPQLGIKPQSAVRKSWRRASFPLNKRKMARRQKKNQFCIVSVETALSSERTRSALLAPRAPTAPAVRKIAAERLQGGRGFFESMCCLKRIE